MLFQGLNHHRGLLLGEISLADTSCQPFFDGLEILGFEMGRWEPTGDQPKGKEAMMPFRGEEKNVT